MMIDYVSILIFLCVVAGFGLGMITVSSLLGKRRPSVVKDSAYECGIAPSAEAQMQFEPKFYLVCLLFLLFDIEIVFLFPLALRAQTLEVTGLLAILTFTGVLLIGYAFAWKTGIFDWNRKK